MSSCPAYLADEKIAHALNPNSASTLKLRRRSATMSDKDEYRHAYEFIALPPFFFFYTPKSEFEKKVSSLSIWAGVGPGDNPLKLCQTVASQFCPKLELSHS